MAQTAEPLVKEPTISPKVAQILEAAGDIFLAHGFGAASMDAIARAAGVSKATLYAHFKGKEELFAAIVSGECQRLEGASEAPLADADLRQGLLQIARNFVDLLLSPKAIRAHRVVVAESQRFPELGRAFYDAGPRVALERVSEFLRLADKSGGLRIADPRIAAEQFLCMIRNHVHFEALLGITEEPDRAGLDRYIDSSVDVFMRGYAP